ncbi:MAG: SulP family inorganic anion transporter [Candidatus Wallbacteria bacterium]|nr:SulP family inorganic anion transporter [Candidatus Wallbacteria bacterium]
MNVNEIHSHDSHRHGTSRTDLPGARHHASLGPAPLREASESGLAARLRYFLMPADERYEDLTRGPWYLNVLRDFTAGLVVAMVAIPLAMGFAMASGLRPEQGILGGAVAGLVGALFGGSKYQVYGPTAAFIPIIAAAVAKHGHPFLVSASLAAGVILLLMGLARLGRFVEMVPHSIVVGFTVGIAGTIALSQSGDILGLQAKMGTTFLAKLSTIAEHLGEVNGYAIFLALLTFAITKGLQLISIYIPAPLISIGFCTAIAATAWSSKGLATVADRFGKIPTDFWVFTPPEALQLSTSYLADFAVLVVSIVFISALESLLCSRMADRLAENPGHKFHSSKEFWGQGMVQILVPLMNGFPHTGALARTATNIKLGAVSPLAGIFKAVLKLLLAVYLASYLEQVPLACIGGILLYVAFNMVKPAEIREVLVMGRLETAMMLYTAVMVLVTNFLVGVVSALVLYPVVLKLSGKLGGDAQAIEPEVA